MKRRDYMEDTSHQRRFLPYALAAFAIGIVGGFSTVLGPAFVEDLGLPYDCTTWTALAQAMSTAACAPILGKVGDRLGRRPTLLWGLGIFTLGNLLSALAGSLGFMLLARFVVGLGTAAMAPVILGFILAEFPADQVGRSFSQYMLISSGAVVFGPTIGGLFLAGPGWRAMLWVCTLLSATIGVLCWILSRGQAPSSRPREAFDGVGAGLILVFFSLALCLPAFAQTFGLSSGIFWGTFAAFAISGVGLVTAERRAKNPILSGKFLGKPRFFLSILALFLTQGLMQANMTNAMVFLRYVNPESALSSGLTVSVLYLGMSLGAVVLGPMADRHPPKGVLALALVLTALGCGGLLGVTAGAPTWALMVPLGILGLGLGGVGTIFLKVALSGLAPEESGAASGTFGLFRDLSAPFGVAVLVPLFTRRVTAAQALGLPAPQAAAQALHTLAWVELGCIAGAALAVCLIPRKA